MEAINEIKLIFSDLMNSAKAIFMRCDNCGEYHITHRNHHITKKGFWKATFICMSCGEKQ